MRIKIFSSVAFLLILSIIFLYTFLFVVNGSITSVKIEKTNEGNNIAEFNSLKNKYYAGSQDCYSFTKDSQKIDHIDNYHFFNYEIDIKNRNFYSTNDSDIVSNKIYEDASRFVATLRKNITIEPFEEQKIHFKVLVNTKGLSSNEIIQLSKKLDAVIIWYDLIKKGRHANISVK